MHVCAPFLCLVPMEAGQREHWIPETGITDSDGSACGYRRLDLCPLGKHPVLLNLRAIISNLFPILLTVLCK